MSSSERDRCSLSSLLPMSCRDRAESFARRLHSRLSSLGSQEDGANLVADESSWLASSCNDAAVPVAVSQPRHSSAAAEQHFLDFGLLESPGSPEDDIPEPDFVRLINGDGLPKNLLCGKGRMPSVDSDSSDTFYDLESDSDVGVGRGEIGRVNGEVSGGDEGREEKEEMRCLVDVSEESSLSPPEEGGSPQEEEVSCLPEEAGETYCSHLNVENDLTVECSYKTEVTLTTGENEDTNDIEDEDEINHIPRVRRCSSLKTGKTPPGTPGRKKIVRFADALGLDLADVRTFLDEIPKIPTSAYEDLTDADLSEDTSTASPNPLTSESFGFGSPRHPDKLLVCMFQQPGGQPDFLDRVRNNQVCLENAVVSDPVSLAISGTVRVRNLDFNKSVHIRYTLDSWKTFADLQASYVENSCDGFSDKFSFLLYANSLGIGQRLEFAVRFQCRGCQYWDSNGGANYSFQCLPSTPVTQSYYPLATSRDWAASFY